MEKNQTKLDPSNIKPPHPLNKVERCRNCIKRESSLCAVLACDELDRLEEIMTPMKFTPGQTIFTEGDDLTHYYTLNEGVIRLVKFLPDGRRAILDFLYKGDFLGLNLEGHYSYSAEAVTKLNICCFSRPKLQAMFEDIPKMNISFAPHFSATVTGLSIRAPSGGWSTKPRSLSITKEITTGRA